MTWTSLLLGWDAEIVARKVATTAKAFEADLHDWVRVSVRPAVIQQRTAVVLDLFRDLVANTPVGNVKLWDTKYPPKGYVGGTARASWFITSDYASTTKPVANVPGTNDLGQSTEAEALSAAAEKVRTIWIVNNLPYIERIMEEGWSTQAPPGTFSAVLARIKAKWGL
jgi:hypothetical protein